MDESAVAATLRDYMVREILEGAGEGFDSQTPLLEWGILNSMEIVRLVAFIRATYGVDIPAQAVTPDHFRTVDAIARLVAQCA